MAVRRVTKEHHKGEIKCGSFSVPFFFPLWVCLVTKRVYSLLIDVAHLPATPLQETPCVGRQSVMGGVSVCVMCEICV